MTEVEDPAAADERELERLLRFLTRPGLDFGLGLVLFVDPAVARDMRARATELAGDQGCRVATLDLALVGSEGDIIQGLGEQLADADAVFVHALDQQLEDTLGHPLRPASLVNLNHRRDQLPELLSGRVVLWVSKRLYPRLAKIAWDLLEVSLTRVEFVGVAEPVVEHLDPERVPEWFEFVREAQMSEHRKLAHAWLVHADSASDPRAEAEAAATAATLFVSTVDFDLAQAQLERATTLFGRVGALAAAASQRARLADLLGYRGNYERAEEHAHAAVRLARTAGIWATEAQCRQTLADTLRHRGQWEESATILDELATDSEARGDASNLAIALAKSGALFTAHDQFERAEAALQRASDLFAELGDDANWASARNSFADLRFAQGHLDEARRIYLEEVAPVVERLGDERQLAILRGRVARIHVAQGQLDLALHILRDEELPVFERLNDKFSALGTRMIIADVQAQQGKIDDAAMLLDNIAEDWRALSNPKLEFAAMLLSAGLYDQQGRSDAALTRYEAAEQLAAQLGVPLGPEFEQALARLRGSPTNADK
jgi:tetratricopeptide (TPR) repeat protein